MAKDLFINDFEFLAARQSLQSQCAELESILIDYSTVMNGVGARGLDTLLIRSVIRTQTASLKRLAQGLSTQGNSLSADIKELISEVNAIDRY